MSDWQEYKLKEVVDKFIDYRGKTPSKSDKGIPLITAKIVKNGRILEPNEFIPLDQYETWMTRGLPEVNDVVLTTEAPLGEVALLKDKNVALAQRIIALRGSKELCNNIFLKYYLQSNIGQAALQSRAQGTTVEGIKSAELKEIEILIPEINEQKAIADILDSLDGKIDLLHRSNKTLEAMVEVIFRQWFIEGVEDHWVEGVVSDVAYVNPLRSLKKGQLASYLDMANMPLSGSFPLGWITREFSGGMRFINGDILIARITPCLENGKTAYVNFLPEGQIGWGSTEYIVLAPKDDCYGEFLYCLARNDEFRDYAIVNMTGTSGRQRVSGEAIAQFKMRVPPTNMVEKFHAMAQQVFEKVKHNSLQIRNLESLRNILLPKLISGEIRIKM